MTKAALIVALLVFWFSPFPAGAARQYCPEQPEIEVSSDDAAAMATVCRTADRAIAYLARFGLYPLRHIHFKIMETSSMTSEGYDVYGRFDSRSDTIELMSYRAITAGLASPSMYGEPFDEIHYLGAITHEVVHAVMQHNLRTELISPAPQEYLAHAVQLALMPAVRREKIIAAMNVGPWEPGDAISDIYMAFEPGKFAVKSYLHLAGLAEPEAFVRILLNANWFYVYVP